MLNAQKTHFSKGDSTVELSMLSSTQRTDLLKEFGAEKNSKSLLLIINELSEI